jgi:hypothetical protein
MVYMTTNQAYSVGGSGCRGILIQNNAALTGTLTVKDGTTTVGVITNPTVGSQYRYYGFTGLPTVTPSTTCDATVSALNTRP